MIRSALLLVALAACAPSPASSVAVAPSQAPAAAAPDTGFIHVNGTGVVSVEPDLARVSFAVESEAPDAQSAVRDNAERMGAVIAALRDTDGDVEIETHGYSLQPRYTRPSPDTGERRIAGYTALNHVRVTVDRIDGVGTLIDAATGAGANRVASLSFGASNLDEANREALRLAVEDARDQATTIARALGVPLGPALEVRTGSQQTPMFEESRMTMAMAAADTPIEAGEQTVRVTVSIRYRLGGE